MFAKVAFPISNFKTFSYKIPSRLISLIQVGTRVEVPFGKKKSRGIITELNNVITFKGNVKEILDVVDDVRIMTPEIWKLINWMSSYYLTPIGQVAKTIFPKSLSTKYKPAVSWYVKKNNIYSSYAINFRTPEDRKPTSQEIKRYSVFLKEHISIIDPKVLILFGSTAMELSLIHI